MAAVRRLLKELRDAEANTGSAVTVGPSSETDLFHWTGYVTGPEGTPYEHGVFCIDIVIPVDYPFKPPRMHFTTKIYHPNINSNGHFSLDELYDAWSPALTIIRVLQSIRSLLALPNPDDPLMPDIALEYMRSHERFVATASEWTRKYAT